MKTLMMTLALCVAAGSAAAQPQPPLEELTGDPSLAPPPPPPEPAPPTPPPPPPAPVMQREPITEPIDDNRPSAFSVAVGLGYVFPTSLETPNVTSVRFRMPSGITFEPQLTLASTTSTVDTGTPIKNSVAEIGLGALARFPVVKRGRVDLEILGSLGVSTVKTSPDQPDADQTVTRFSAGYGVAVTSWLSSHWQLSLSALNPFITSVKQREEEGPGTSTVTKTTTFGIVFDPSVLLMVHLYH